MNSCYICCEPIFEESFNKHCSCKGSLRLHEQCFQDLLDKGFEFCSICGDYYRNIDGAAEVKFKQLLKPWSFDSDFDGFVAQMITRKNGKKSVFFIDKLGRLQGECNVYYMGKTLLPFSKAYYVNGKIEGKYIEYFKPFENQTFSEVLMESTFKNGVPNGLCRFYYRSERSDQTLQIYKKSITYGPLCEECFYKDGLTEGLVQSFYKDEKRKIKELKNYKAGKLNGKYQEFDISGKIICEGFYENDVKKGVWKSYSYY